MPSATTQLYSFPAQLGRRGTTMLAVIGLHVVLAIGLIAGMTMRRPVPVTDPVPPPIVIMQPPPVPVVPRDPSAPDIRRSLPDVVRPVIEPVVIAPVEMPVAPPEAVPAAGPEGTTAIYVSNVRVLRGEPPLYPAVMRRLGKEGSVGVRVRVGAAGRPELVEVATSSGYAAFDNAAVDAVRHWMFAPAQTASGPVSSWVTLRVTFQLTS